MPLLADDEPLDPQQAEAQLAGLIKLLGAAPRNVLDLGCGRGRTILPLAAQGHHCIGIDRDPDAVRACAEAASQQSVTLELHELDFLDIRALQNTLRDRQFDAILCLGNTFMTIVDVDRAADCVCALRAMLRDSSSMVVLDDIPGENWPEVAEGFWQNGISEDGSAQMVWARDDAVFTIRTDPAIDPDAVDLRANDTLLRLWTMGDLTLLARLAGLSAPDVQSQPGLLILRPL